MRRACGDDGPGQPGGHGEHDRPGPRSQENSILLRKVRIER